MNHGLKRLKINKKTVNYQCDKAGFKHLYTIAKYVNFMLNMRIFVFFAELPDTSFTRSISNPEAVMRRRRQQKLEKKLQQFR